ncbi:MAG: OmpA family protein [Leptospirales bacterium]|nr:OmpA family protein [Leptospirales bacterium]
MLLLAQWLPAQPAAHNQDLAGAQTTAAEVNPAADSPSTRSPQDSVLVQNLELPNWQGDDYAPQISPDGRFLVFQSDRPGRFENHNLWYSENKNAADRLGPADWTIPAPLALPLEERPSPTMRITRPIGSLEDPAGAFSPNTNGFDGMASLVYRNGQPVEIYFTASADGQNGRVGQAGMNLYFSRYRDQRWSEVREIQEVSSDFDDRMPFVSQDGKRLYFSSNRPGGQGGYDLWYSERDLSSGLWSRPVNAGPAVNTRFHEISPQLDPQGRQLFFSSDRPGGLGSYDLYVSRWSEDSWGAPQNLGEPFNSSRDEEYFSIPADGLWAYFASDRRFDRARGEFDLYRVTLPEYLRTPTAVLFSAQILDGVTRRALGVAATVRIIGGAQEMVERSRIMRRDPGDEEVNNFSQRLASGRIYRLVFSAPGYAPQELSLDYRGNLPAEALDRRVILLRPLETQNPDGGAETQPPGAAEEQLIEGRVVDASNNLPLPGARVLLAMAGKPPAEVRIGREGEFRLRIAAGQQFRLDASAIDFRPRSESYRATPDLRRIILALQPLGGGGPPCPGEAPECLDNLRVYFDINSSALRPAEQRALDAVVRIMKAHPEVRIEIRGHTDHTNTQEYNQRLSESRARSVLEYLLRAGLAPERLAQTGRSFLEPAVTPESGVRERSQNRRVEFRRILENP